MPIFFNILLIAISLSMDTFSLSLSYGLLNKDKRIIYKMVSSVGLFHFIMPLLGNSFGVMLFRVINIDKNLIIGLIFLIISVEMLLSMFKNDSYKEINNNIQVLLFSFAVSVDSFSVGIALDALQGNNLFIATVFMIISSIFTYIGMMFGKYINNKFGKRVELIGVVLLLILSLTYILKVF